MNLRRKEVLNEDADLVGSGLWQLTVARFGGELFNLRGSMTRHSDLEY
jgi:hypothetical protein